MIFAILFTVFWFFLPAGLANMFPIFAAHIPGLKKMDYPLDFYKNFQNKRILGDHKTIRGLVVAVIVGVVTVLIQKHLYVNSDWLQQTLQLNYSLYNPVYLGALLGLGAILGDAVKSFFKRQFNIPSGETWMLFDQLDYIIGGIIFTYWYAPLSVTQYSVLILLYFGLHLLSTVVGYLLGLKQKPI